MSIGARVKKLEGSKYGQNGQMAHVLTNDFEGREEAVAVLVLGEGKIFRLGDESEGAFLARVCVKFKDFQLEECLTDSQLDLTLQHLNQNLIHLKIRYLRANGTSDKALNKYWINFNIIKI